VLLVLLELGLSLAADGGPTPGRLRLDPRASYLVPDPDVPGGWRTRFSSAKRDARAIPPKGHRERVVLFGGSVTDSLRFAELQQRLDERAPGRFEVVNLGIPGYGSERTALVLRQAIELLSPDVAFIYTGDLEFLEIDASAGQEDGDEGTLARLVRESHIGALLERLRARAGAGDADREPEPLTRRGDALFEDFTYEDTLARYEALGANLRGMCRAALDADLRVVVSTVIYNRFSVPYVSTFPADMSAADRAEFELLHAAAEAELPSWIRPLLPRSLVGRVRPADWMRPQGAADAAPPDATTLGRRPSFGPLADQDPGLPDPARWSSRVVRILMALDKLHERSFGRRQREAFARAEELLEEALALCPDHPRALFELALVTYARGGDDARVARLFADAARYDRAPRKGNDAVNAIIREVAAELPGVELLDADALFAARVPDGLVGWEWMLDQCHFTVGAGKVLMADLAELLVPEPAVSEPR